jgi:DNA-binding CsgD family transcriptional regulator
MRSAAYYAASGAVRRRAHEALAVVTDPVAQPDRRAWHLAAAALGPDEEVAAGLEESAGRARARGGWVSSAAFLERAAELTPDAGQRAHRLLEAAEARLVAGDVPAAGILAGRAGPDLAGPLARAKARRIAGLTLYAAGRMPEATTVLLEAAALLQPLDSRLAVDTLLNAFAAAQLSGDAGAGTARVLEMVQAASAADGEKDVADLLLDGYAALAERRYADGAALLRQAIAPLAGDRPIPDETLPYFLAITTAAGLLHDDAARHELERRWVAELRDRGALAALLVALTVQLTVQIEEGRFTDSDATLAEGWVLSEATGYRAYLGSFVWVKLWGLAWQGREADIRPLAARLLGEFTERGEGNAARGVHRALAVLELGLGNYAAALRHARENQLYQDVLEFGAVTEVVEAAVRSGERETAAAALAALEPWALATGTHWALGLLARCRALLADDGQAEADYQLAIEHLRQTRIAPELARAHLVYGEWLRRRRRRRDARGQLRTAFQLFERLGMAAFASRARAELRATGEHATRRAPGGADEVLTPQETQIARLAGEGATNAEIAARLFISAATVEYHLHKVFRKLSITTRVQLARLATPDND